MVKICALPFSTAGNVGSQMIVNLVLGPGRQGIDKSSVERDVGLFPTARKPDHGPLSKP